MSKRLKSDLALVLAAFVWGTAFVAQRIAALNQSVFVFNGLRFLLGVLILLPFIGIHWGFDRAKIINTSLSGVVLFFASSLQQLGLQYTPAGNAGFLTSLYVVFVPLQLWLFWREKPYWLIWLAVTLSILGAFLLSTGGNITLQRGDLIELIAALFWAFHVILVGRFSKTINPLRFAAGQFFTCSLLSLAVGVAFERIAIVGLPIVAASIIYTGVFSIGLGYTLQAIGQKYTPTTEAALIMSLESIVAALSGWLILQEALSLLQIIGCALILCAILIVQIRNGKINLYSRNNSADSPEVS